MTLGITTRDSSRLRFLRSFDGMASVLNKLLLSLTPPPVINPVDYDGLEYKWKFFAFRPARESALFVPISLDANSGIQSSRMKYTF